MANFKSKQMTPPVYPISGPGMGGRSLKVERAFFDLALIGTLAIGDTVDLFKLHPRFRVIAGFIKSTGTAAMATLAVGDLLLANRFFTATAITVAGTTTTLAETGRDYLTPAGFTLVQGVVGGAATGATGTITVVLYGFIEEPE